MSAPASAFSIDEYRDADESPVVELLHQCLGTGTVDWRDGRVWRWKHMDNPYGRSLVLVARAPDGHIMGLRAFMRWEMTARRLRIRAYRPVDTATNPEYRRLGIFSALTREALRRAREEGVALTFNTPNAMSLPGYLKMGWKSVTPIRPVVKVTNFPRLAVRAATALLRRAGSGERAGRIAAPNGDASVRAVLDWSPIESVVSESAVSDETRVQGRKTTTYLRWRYLVDPVYEHVAVSIEEDRATRGCCFARPVRSHGASGMLIEDLFVTGNRTRAAHAVMRRIVREYRPDFLMTYFTSGSSLHAIVQGLGFRTMSRRGSNFVVNPLGAEAPLDLLGPQSWALAMGEVEFF